MPSVDAPRSRAHRAVTRIRAEQARQLHDGVPRLLRSNWGGCLCATVISWQATPLSPAFLLAWCAAFTLYAVLHRQRHRREDVAQVDAALRRSVRASATSGLLWAVYYFGLLATGQPLIQHLVLAVLAVHLVGSLMQVGLHLPSFVAMVLAPSAAVAAGLWTWGEGLTRQMAWVALFFAAGGLSSGRAYAEHVRRLWRLRFENLDLIDELSVQTAAAEQANLAKSRFLASASHDLRQPLLALQLCHGELDRVVQEAQVRPLLDQARHCAQAMQDMFSVLLDLSQLESGVLQPRQRAIEVQPLLQRLHVEFEQLARHKGVSLRIGRGDARLHTDPDLLAMLLRNLLSNALRYTDRGAVLMGVRHRAGIVRIEVWDTGCGIPPDGQQRIFQPYERLQPDDSEHPGFGLGLAIVQRLSGLIDARVSVRSEVGKGSVFGVEMGGDAGSRPVDDRRDRVGMTCPG